MPADAKITLLRRRGKVARRHSLPACQATAHCNNAARLDCKSWDGRWGFCCARCWPSFALHPNLLGTGIGSYLMTYSETDLDIPTWVG